jgi:hypothetical protein
MNEFLNLTGNLEIIKKDKDGNIVETRNIPNLVVNAGKNAITQRLVHNSGNTAVNPYGGTFARMAIGTTDTAPTLADTSLGTNAEIQSISPLQNVISSNTVTYTAVFVGKGDSLTHSVKEAGIFNSPTANSGTMLCRTTFAAISKETDSSLTINWNITVS